MPASPESKTIWPAPAQASRRRSRNRALSAARPTRSVSPRRAASNRLSVTATPSTAKASTGSAKPFAVCRPRSAAGTGRRRGGGWRRRGRSARVPQEPAGAPRGWGSRRPPPAPAPSPRRPDRRRRQARWQCRCGRRAAPFHGSPGCVTAALFPAPPAPPARRRPHAPADSRNRPAPRRP